MSTVGKALSLLDLFSEARPLIGLTEFQQLSSRDKATVYRHLCALEEKGLIEQEPKSKAYRLGHAIERLAHMRRRTVRDVDTVASIIDAISLQAGELVHITRFSGQELQVIYHQDHSRRAIRVEFENDIVLPLLASSSGKVVLAHMDEATQLQAIKRQHKQFGCPPMPEKDQIFRDLSKAEKRGFATSSDTVEIGVSSIAIPVFNADAEPAGACSITYPSVRASKARMRELALILFENGAELTKKLGGRVPQEISEIWAKALLDPVERKSA